MGLDYKNLDSATRSFMLEEIEFDCAAGTVYISNYLNEHGANSWPDLLKQAAKQGNDDTLSSTIEAGNFLKHEVPRKKPSGGFTIVRVPVTAHVTLGEGEFGRYYVRGLCRRAISEGIAKLVVYRAKAVAQPRPGSEEKIGVQVDPNAILDDLRKTVGVEPLLGLPPGPNSGLTLRLP
jgi:hypothetical protein